MTRHSWITTGTLFLLAIMTCTVGLDGCSDDGTGTIPDSLYATPHGEGGSATDPGSVSTQTTPPGVPPAPDAAPTDDVVQPKKDTGTTEKDTGTQDTGTQTDTGTVTDAADSG